MRRLVWVVALVPLTALPTCRKPEPRFAMEVVEPPPAEGELAVSVYDGGTAAPSTLHRSVWVAGTAAYGGMEDNDLRGHLDGSFKYGWNQVGQNHVRVGRRDRSSSWGECEIFRVVQRWAGSRCRRVPWCGTPRSISESKAARIGRCGSTSTRSTATGIGAGGPGGQRQPSQAGRGSGGTMPASRGGPGATRRRARLGHRPRRRHPGGSPGGSGSTRPAEVPDLPRGGARRLRHPSAAAGLPAPLLAQGVGCDGGRPTGSVVVYSANQGDLRNPARRPRLTLTWEAPGERVSQLRPLLLEHGRTLMLPPLQGRGCGRWR
jgi:hypothetical protein